MNNLKENIMHLYAEKGVQWLAHLSQEVARLEIAHGLSRLKPFKHLSYHYVLSGFQGTQPIVLKLGCDSDVLHQEALALKAFSGKGIVNLLAEAEGMLLLECATPGTALKSYFPEKDKLAIEIACACLKNLHQAPIPAGQVFPHINDWLVALDETVNIPQQQLDKAQHLRNRLIATMASPVLLHGDLHHDNILQQGDDWVVIDPKGVIGEPAYDIAAFIRNPLPQLLTHPGVKDIIAHRIKFFANRLNLPEQRLWDWCYVQAILAWIWAIEDGTNVVCFKQLAALFYES